MFYDRKLRDIKYLIENMYTLGYVTKPDQKYYRQG